MAVGAGGQGTQASHTHPLFTDYHGDDQLRDNVAAVAQLGSWPKEAKEIAMSRVGKQGESEPDSDLLYIEPWTDDAVTDALDGILRIWTEVLERKITTSVTLNGRASGPLAKFAGACLAVLNLDRTSDGNALTSEAIRARIRRR